MPTEEQLKSLIKAHFNHEPECFNSAALSIAAYEAARDNVQFALDIKKIIDKSRKDKKMAEKYYKFKVIDEVSLHIYEEFPTKEEAVNFKLAMIEQCKRIFHNENSFRKCYCKNLLIVPIQDD